MKKTPRIHSLSTLGIIHHQEFDYEFHPLRTDFVGESGSGKSMIADILQLIFVGSDAFDSASKSLDKRDPDGLVLKSPGRGTDMGYAILNIEVTDSCYITIGTYIESNSRHTHSFIIQEGYDFEDTATLVPIKSPLKCKDFLLDNQILPIDELQKELRNRGLILDYWQRLKTYHKILFNNQILPFDLSLSDKHLKDYAKIIQSFSRGSSITTQKSQDLKDFLFGNNKAKEILSDYNRAVDDLKSMVNEYGSNLEEINKVTQKQKELAHLKQLKDTRDNEKKALLRAEVTYYRAKKNSSKVKAGELIQSHLLADAKLRNLIILCQKELEDAKSNTENLESIKGESERVFLEMDAKNQKIKRVKEWLKDLNCDRKDLKKKFDEQKKLLHEQALLIILRSSLVKENLSNFFSQSDWAKKGYNKGNSSYNSSIVLLGKEIKEKYALLSYSNFENPESLGFWARSMNRPLNLFEESTVIHFLELTKTKPKEEDGARYLPEPTELFNNLPVADENNGGFWLNLQGVREFIKLVDQQLLDTNDPDVITSHFGKYSENLKNDISTLETKRRNLKRLNDLLDSIDNIADCIKAFQNESKFGDQKIISTINISVEEFNEHLDCFDKADDILKRHKELRGNYDKAIINWADNGKLIESLGKEIDEALKLNTQLATILCNKILGEDATISLNIPKEEELLKELKILLDTENKAGAARDMFSSLADSIVEHDSLNAIWNTHLNAVNEGTLKEGECVKQNIALEDTESPELEEIQQPSDSEYKTEQIKYNTEYEQIVRRYLEQDAYRFENIYDFVSLSMHLLPQAFHAVDVAEEAVIDTIAHYLNRINQKNSQLNGRKIQKIKDLIEEVYESVSKSMETVFKIDTFFRQDDKQITGGHKVKLEVNYSKEYPVEWLQKFKQTDLKFEEGGVFPEPPELVSHLSRFISLEEKMLAAFYACGGQASIKPTITKLLDPNSYFDLSFTMKASDGRINKGSSGQTYSAVALLCIARLSLIGKDDGGKSNPGVRFMPIDEAEGLGSNFDMLYNIARDYDFQIISLSISPVGYTRRGEFNMFMLHKNMEVSEQVNYKPYAILSNTEVKSETETTVVTE